MNRILILDNSTDYSVYRPLEHWKPLLLFPFDSFHASAGELPSRLDPYSHMILTGSQASVLENADWMVAEMELIRLAVETGKVILGVCFGHQMIAGSLFGMSAVRKRENPEVGWPDIEVIKSDPLLGESGQIINCFVLHFDEVCHLPEEKVTVLARSSECSILSFKLKHRPVWGIQPHPEIGIVEGLNLIKILVGSELLEKQYLSHAAQSSPKDSGWIVPLIREFQKIRPDSDS